MMMILIRPATQNDLPELLPLMEQWGYSIDLETMKKQFDLFCNQNDYGVAVAELENKIVGWIAWSKSIMFLPKTRIHLEGLVVDSNYRKKGIGKKLIDYIEKIAKQFSPCIIDLTSGKRRAKEGTHKFYEKLGYKNEGPRAKLYLRKEV